MRTDGPVVHTIRYYIIQVQLRTFKLALQFFLFLYRLFSTREVGHSFLPVSITESFALNAPPWIRTRLPDIVLFAVCPFRCLFLSFCSFALIFWVSYFSFLVCCCLLYFPLLFSGFPFRSLPRIHSLCLPHPFQLLSLLVGFAFFTY